MDWDDDAFMSFDFETSGREPEYALQPWRIHTGDFWATDLVWGWRGPDRKHRLIGEPYPTKAMMVEMLEQALDERRIMVGWNVLFDIGVLLAYGLEHLVNQCSFIDGMHMWRHLFIEPEYEMSGPSKFSYRLKLAVPKWLGEQYGGYEEGIDFHGDDPETVETRHTYNQRDTLYTLLIAKRIWNKLKPKQRNAAIIESKCLPLVAMANLRGMRVDTLEAQELSSKLDATALKMLTELAPHGITEKVVRSPVQLSKLMFDTWKLQVLKENKSKLTGNVSRSTDKETLHELSFVDDRVAKVRAYREALNNKAKFAQRPIESTRYCGDGNTHPQAIVFGTYSGRMTYSSKQGKNKAARPIGFALHQEKRDAEFRNIIIAPPGHTIVEFDAAGQEFRWMAIASADDTMLKLCLPGEDPHSFMGSRIIRADYHEMIELVDKGDKVMKDGRQLGKVANLSLQYRTSAKKLRSVARVQYNIPMDHDTSVLIWSVYRKTYPGVMLYWEKQIAKTQAIGYVETFAGRRVQVTGDWKGSNGWSMGSTSINYRIQGTGADQKYLALMYVKDIMHAYNVYFGWDLHDGLYFYVPDEKVEKFAREVKDQLDNLPYGAAWGFVPPVPLPWDCKTGKSWGALKNFKFN